MTRQAQLTANLLKNSRLFTTDTIAMAMEGRVLLSLDRWLPTVVDDFAKVKVDQTLISRNAFFLLGSA